MKKLFFTLLLAAATLPGWADETQLTIIGGATSAGWATGDGSEGTRVLERTVGRMVRKATNTWVWVGTLTTGTDDAGNFKITNGAGSGAWDGYWAPSKNKEVGNSNTEDFNLSTEKPGGNDWKFHVTTTGMYRITVDLSQSTKKMTVDKLSAPTQDANGYYQIGTADQFMWFAGKVTSEESSSLKAKLTADISFSGKNFFPLACEKHQFKGELDGAGHTIDYAVIDDPRDIVGIFRYLAPGANVHDLVIGSNCSFTGSNNVGGIAGKADGTGEVTLSNVINAATIHANNKANGTNAAGFVAFADGATVNVTNCANLGQTCTNGESAKSAAFIGWIATAASFTNCWNGGTINDMDGTNNLYRTTQTITVDNCYDVSGGNCGQCTQLATTAKGSGELCYKLNGNQSNIKWYQTLHGTDSHPYPFDTHKQVYQVSETSYSNLSVVDGKVQINDANDLVTFSAEVNAGNTALNAVLTNNIDMSGVNDYTPIGTADNLYSGTFDGDTHRIKNLVINNDIKEQGLFSVCTGATIKNLILDSSCSIKSTKSAWANAAFVAVCNGSGTLTFENCGNEASVEGTSGNNAAFLGKNYSTSGLKIVLSNCYNTGTIKGGGYNAAFVGESDEKEVTTTNCYNKGNVERNDGGNATWINGKGTKNITNCYTTLASEELTNLTTSYSEDKITSGELCYKLGPAFTQDLSQDGHPTFGSKTVTAGKWFNDTNNDVYYNEESGNITVYKIDINENQTAYNVPANVKATHFSFTRNYIANQWVGICTPISFLCPSDWEARELTDVTGNGENASMKFSEVTAIYAGKPYIVKPSRTEETIFSGGNISIISAADYESNRTKSINGINMIGNIGQTTIPQGSFYINKSSELKKLTAATATLKGFRAYFTVDGGNGVKALSFDFDDDATGISLMEDGRSQMEDGAIYNVAGQRIQKMQKGINIVNGKKILK